MSDASFNTVQLQEWIGRMRNGDSAAREELARRACDRLQRLTRKMLRGYPGVKRWAETDDVFQSAAMRLFRALETVTPGSILEFFRLAALQIRRELRDLARHYFGPQGLGANYASHHPGAEGEATPLDPPDSDNAMRRLREIHELTDNLGPDLRDVVDQLYYLGFTREEAAKNLGISVETVYRRWRTARLQLHKNLEGD